MTILCHMVLPAAIAGSGLKFLPRVSRRLRLWLMALVALLGSLPDSLAWLWEILTHSPRWFYYATFHAWWMAFIPPAGLHVWMDSFVHLPEGGIVVPLYYILEVACWLVAIPGIYWGIKK